MNDLQNFEQFLSTSSAQFSIFNYSINILITALLAYLLGLLYNRYGNSLSNRKSFSLNFVMLAVTTMIIITIVKSSLALSLGLVGALSIVRFRAAIKEPEELSYLFLNIAIGLGLGANQRVATIVGFIFIVLFLISKSKLYAKSNHENQNLIMNLSILNPEKDFMNRIVEIMKKHLEQSSLKRFDETDNNLEVSFIIEVEDFNTINELKNNLQTDFNNITISLIDNNIIV